MLAAHAAFAFERVILVLELERRRGTASRISRKSRVGKVRLATGRALEVVELHDQHLDRTAGQDRGLRDRRLPVEPLLPFGEAGWRPAFRSARPPVGGLGADGLFGGERKTISRATATTHTAASVAAVGLVRRPARSAPEPAAGNSFSEPRRPRRTAGRSPRR